MNLEEQIRKDIARSVKEVAPNAEVYLFGSRARSNASQDSDWDILVLVDDENLGALEDRIRDRIFDLELNYEQVFSLFIFSFQNWHQRQNITPFYYQVNKDAINL